MADLATPHYGFSIPDPDDPLGGIAGTIEALALQVELHLRRCFDHSGLTSSASDTAMPSSAGVYEDSLSALSFTAPPTVNGRVHVYVSAWLQINLTTTAAFRELWLSAAIREGTSGSPGAEVHAADDADAIMVGVGGVSGDMNSLKASYWLVTPTLTPGDTYHVQTRKKVTTTTGCTINIRNRRIRVFTR